MSYDVYLEIDAGGADPVECFWANHTSNTAGMWKAAGADIATMHGGLAVECGGILARAADRIDADPDAYRRWEAPNGWGDIASTVKFLRELADACARFPKATITVSR